MLPQNRCFVRGFRQFSAHLTKCHACHGICTLSPLDAALPMRFAKNTQHHTSKVLRLPRKMTLDTSKVLRLPRNCNASVPATQNDFRHYKTRLNVTKCHACPAKRSNEKFETSKTDHLCKLTIGTAIRPSRERLGTVEDGCGHKRNVERTHPQPPDPQTPRVKREPLLRIREKGKMIIKTEHHQIPGDHLFYSISREKMRNAHGRS